MAETKDILMFKLTISFRISHGLVINENTTCDNKYLTTELFSV